MKLIWLEMRKTFKKNIYAITWATTTKDPGLRSPNVHLVRFYVPKYTAFR